MGTVHVKVGPRDSLIDAAVYIRVTGLKPRTSVTLTASTVDTMGKAWRFARGTSRTRVELSIRQRTARYTAPTPAHVQWVSMLPVGWKGRPKLVGMAPPTLAQVRIAVHVHGRVVARAEIVRRTTSPDVSIDDETFEQDGFVGRFCSQPAGGPRPAVLRFGGSEGGLPGDATCTVLASHGYPTLNLAYFGLPVLPTALSRIPLEYFERALEWLGRQPGVDPSKVVVMGISRGGEAALIIGSVYPQYVRGVIGLVPSSVVNRAFGGPDPAWTLGGAPLPFLQIPVEQINGPVFVVGAGFDQVWSSSTYVGEIAVRMHQHGRRDVTALVYLKAGHGIGSLLPNFRRATAGQGPEGFVNLGGSPSADARVAAWPKLLRFLSEL